MSHYTKPSLSGGVPGFLAYERSPISWRATEEEALAAAQAFGTAFPEAAVAATGTRDSKALSDGALVLFLELARDADNWSGTPMVALDTREQKGYLTQLKRRRLLSTFVDDGTTFARFTDAGIELAAEHGVSL